MKVGQRRHELPRQGSGLGERQAPVRVFGDVRAQMAAFAELHEEEDASAAGIAVSLGLASRLVFDGLAFSVCRRSLLRRSISTTVRIGRRPNPPPLAVKILNNIRVDELAHDGNLIRERLLLFFVEDRRGLNFLHGHLSFC